MISHTDLLRPKTWNGQPVRYRQRKYSGMRLLVRCITGEVDAYTRDGKTNFAPALWRVPRLRKFLQNLPWGTAVDCEAYGEDVPETSVITLLKSADARLQLAGFALPFYKTEDWRDRSMNDAMEAIEQLGFLPAETHDDALAFTPQEWARRAALRKIEGWVLKEGHWRGWYKVKPVRSADLVVLRTTMSTSDQHFGGLKAIIVGTHDGTELASVGSGFDASWRQSVDRDSLIGRVCEVEYEGLAAQGRLKFPRFLRWREDKSREECTGEDVQ